MSIAKKFISILLALALCLMVGGCNKQPAADTDGNGDYVSERELASSEATNEVKAEYTVKAEVFESLEGYTVIYPDKNEQLRQAAKKLVDYFSKQEITLGISSDSSAAKDKEILLGDTNRQKTSLAENKYAVSLSGTKLFFESGNFNGVVKAVSWFTAQPFEKGKINTLTGEYDFAAEVERADGTYKYVWGDEFDGNVLDGAKWELIIKKINRVILVGKNEYQEKNTTFTPNLKSNELILHLSGKSQVKFNGKILNCESGTIRFLPNGENKEYIVEREEHGECLDVYFDSDIPISDEAFVLKVKNSIKLENLFKKLFSVWVSKNEGYYFESISLLYKIFAEIQKENYIPQKQYDIIKPAIKYIEENFLKEKINISDLASLCGIGESYLKTLFLKKFAIPPVKYIIQLKINYACDLLRSNLYSITQVAEICGYSDTHFFCRQFKTYMGNHFLPLNTSLLSIIPKCTSLAASATSVLLNASHISFFEHLLLYICINCSSSSFVQALPAFSGLLTFCEELDFVCGLFGTADL